MKVHEILNEKLNLTVLYNDLEQTLYNTIREFLEFVSSQLQNQYDDANKLVSYITTYLFYKIEKQFSENIPILLKKYKIFKLDTSANKFDGLHGIPMPGNVYGGVDGTTLYINKMILDNICAEIVNYLILKTKNELNKNKWSTILISKEKKQKVKLNAFLQTISNLLLNFDTEKVNLSKTFTQLLVKTIVHELTHIVQNIHQLDKNKTSLNSRSYLELNKEKANAARKNKLTKNDFRIYHADPEEITAFAQEIALDIIHNDSIIDSTTIWNKIMTHLTNSIGIPKTNKERMVVKRYAKIIYKLIADHLQKA